MLPGIGVHLLAGQLKTKMSLERQEYPNPTKHHSQAAQTKRMCRLAVNVYNLQVCLSWSGVGVCLNVLVDTIKEKNMNKIQEIHCLPQ